MSVVRELGPAAAPPAAPPEEDPEYGWNFGAGVTAGGTVAGFDGFPGTPGVMEGTGYFRPPIYLLSFERRTWASGWFFFGGAAGYVTSDVGSSDGSNSTRRLAVTDVGGLIGIRQVIVSKIVDVSIWAGFGLGYRFVSGDAVPSGASTYWARPGSNAMTLGPRAGLAFERELLQALAVRISAQLVSFDYSRSETVLEGSTNEESSLAFAVGVVPALQLRLYF